VQGDVIAMVKIMDFFQQGKFTEDDIQEMLVSPRRRQIKGNWEFVMPKKEGVDYSLKVPFPPLKRAVEEVFPGINYIPWGSNENYTYYTYLKDVTEEKVAEIRDYFNSIVGCVAIRDRLPISFAIDFDRTEGNPNNPQTEIGEIRYSAKPYGFTKVTEAN
jgi:hypothetical protein